MYFRSGVAAAINSQIIWELKKDWVDYEKTGKPLNIDPQFKVHDIDKAYAIDYTY